MRTLLVVLGLLMTGCAHTTLEGPKTALLPPIPCRPSSCGKTVQWETM